MYFKTIYGKSATKGVFAKSPKRSSCTLRLSS
jgi:hypothetical protein